MKNIKNILNKNEILVIIILFLIVASFVFLIPGLNSNFIKTNKLYINEIMVNNTYTYKDDYEEYSDYIEIYNGYNYDINLNGYHLSDDEFETNKWTFPNILIKSKEYLMVYASNRDECNFEAGICHTNFKLSSKGETIIFSDNNNNIINKFSYEKTANDVAYGYSLGRYKFLNVPTPKEKNNSTKFKNVKLSNNDIYITEYMTSNKRNSFDSEGNYNDFVELYNNSGKEIELNNIYLSDDHNVLDKYKIPNVIINKDDYLVIYLGDESKVLDGQIVANFKLSEGEELILSNGKKIIDEVKLVDLSDNISYGKFENKWYYFTKPTPGRVNNTKKHSSLRWCRMSVLKVFRHEYKYSISYEEMLLLRKKLNDLLTIDRSYDGYIVRSLYFDSINDVDYYEKLDGLINRKKIRLRIYEPGAKKVKLELKSKYDYHQQKESLIITREEAEEMIKGNYGVLFNHDEDIATKIYTILTTNCYKPKVIIEYHRIAYTTKNDTRITFDFNIKKSNNVNVFFKEDINYLNLTCPQNIVLEVKFNRFLEPYISNVLGKYIANKESVSKYVMGRNS